MASRWRRFSVIIQDGKHTVYMEHVRAETAEKAKEAGVRKVRERTKDRYRIGWDIFTGGVFQVEAVYHGHVRSAT